MNGAQSNEQYIQKIIEKQQRLLEARNQDLITLRQKLAEYEHAISEKDFYLAKLEMDLEHAIGQCQKIAAAKNIPHTNNWIIQQEPKIDK